MCLFTREEKPLIADKDISCYKVLCYKNGEYYTPFRDYRVQFEQKMIDDTEETSPKAVFDFFEIDCGYYHTCGTLKSVRIVLLMLKTHSTRNKLPLPKLRIFKATIPKGSAYYDGLREDYCSKELIIHNEIVDKI